MESAATTRQFEYFVPLEKAREDEDGNWILDGPLSSERPDLQGQRMLRAALRKGLKPYEKIGCPVDWNHYSVKKGGPEWTVGNGELHTGPSADGKETDWLRTTLKKHNPHAKTIWDDYQNKTPLFYSVGGQCAVDRRGDIIDSVIDHVAITDRPAQPDALIGFQALAKSLLGSRYDDDSPSPGEEDAGPGLLDANRFFDEDLLKTLCAGSGPGMESTGGRALVGEDLEGGQKRTARKKRKRRHLMKTAETDMILDDPEIERQIDELIADDSKPETSKLASFFKSLVAKVQSLTKSDDDADDTDDEDEDEDEGGESDDEGGVERRGMHKSAFGDDLDGAAVVPADDFLRELRAMVRAELAPLRKEMRQTKADLTTMQKTLTATSGSEEGKEKPASQADVQELNKSVLSLNEILDGFGRKPRQQEMQKSADGADAKEPGGATRSKEETKQLLEKAIIAGITTPVAMTQFEISGEVDEAIIRRIEGK